MHTKLTRFRWLAGAVALAAAMPAIGQETHPNDRVVDKALDRADAAIDRIVEIPGDERTVDNTLGAIDDVLARLELDTNMVMFLAYVSTDAAERAAGERAEERVTNWLIEMQKREDLYEAVKAFAATAPVLSGEQQRLLEHAMRDYRRAGMELTSERREQLKTIQKEITRLGIEFERNIRQDETRVPLSRQELSGVPDEYFENPNLEQVGDVYLVAMAYPQFIPVMTYCDNETTREKVWLAYKRRGGRNNVEVLEKMLKLRAQAARILGYDNTADYEIEIRMAKNADTVQAFYEKLRPLVRRKALADRDELLAAKRAHTGEADPVLYPWDSDFYMNYLKKTKYAVDSEKVREYLPLNSVIEGLFTITQALYGLEYRDITDSRTAQLWHPDVRLYEVWDTENGVQLGEFYLDLHPRPNKYSHAAQWGLAQHKVWSDGRVTRPLAALVCNYPKPTPDKPSLLTHDEAETLFHEFGHCLHTILGDTQYYQFGGTNVERDFVEAPSQMFENWVWDADVVRTFARHYRTGEPLPDELLEGMLNARYLGSGMLAERQFYYGLFDLDCHLDPEGDVDTTKLAWDLWSPDDENVELYDPVPETYFQASFGHLNGYQAGYYGYQWSLVYACDMFQRFKELGLLSPEAGRYYRQKILSRGGSRDGLDLVRDYLGREPEMDAYLEHLGLGPQPRADSRTAAGGQ